MSVSSSRLNKNVLTPNHNNSISTPARVMFGTYFENFPKLRHMLLTSAHVILLNSAEFNISFKLGADVHSLVPKLLVPNIDRPKVIGSGIKNERSKRLECERF